jgi:hypothetical protein
VAVSDPKQHCDNVPNGGSSVLYINFRVKDTLEEFLNRNDLPQIQNSFNKEFPDSINISQAIAVWKCIVNYQYRLKQN